MIRCLGIRSAARINAGSWRQPFVTLRCDFLGAVQGRGGKIEIYVTIAYLTSFLILGVLSFNAQRYRLHDGLDVEVVSKELLDATQSGDRLFGT